MDSGKQSREQCGGTLEVHNNSRGGAKIAEQRNPKIHLKFIAKRDIDQIQPQSDTKWEGVLAVPKTHKMH